MRHRAFTLVIALAAVAGLARPAAAQAVTSTFEPPLFEFSVGYQFLRINGASTDNTFQNGFAIDGARYYGPFAIVAEVGWSTDSTSVPGVEVSSGFLHVGAGPRLLFVRQGRIRPYVQVLGGLSRASFDSEIRIGDQIVEDIDETDSAFMVQPGGGITFVMGSAFGLFGSVDYRRSFFDEGPGLGYSDTNEIRVFAGARLILD